MLSLGKCELLLPSLCTVSLVQIFDCSVLIVVLSFLQALFQLSPEAAGPCLDHR